ncbi:hypothetical protein [Sinobaca sp. H24]|uniref:hypothetical protein n=1 Tax=Sinobaca sp. H24 TaxID=2923376 RepID=UPI0035ADDF12
MVVGNTFGRNPRDGQDLGRRVKSAAPSTPVEITGLSDVPQAGDQFVVFEDEKKARSVGEQRAARAKDEERNLTNRVSIDDLFSQIQDGNMKEINVIVSRRTGFC